MGSDMVCLHDAQLVSERRKIFFLMFYLLLRLLYRAYQVCQTSNEVLVEKLGLDIPPTPDVTLEEVTDKLIRISWKHPDLQNSIHKNVIQINGVKGL